MRMKLSPKTKLVIITILLIPGGLAIGLGILLLDSYTSYRPKQGKVKQVLRWIQDAQTTCRQVRTLS